MSVLSQEDFKHLLFTFIFVILVTQAIQNNLVVLVMLSQKSDFASILNFTHYIFNSIVSKDGTLIFYTLFIECGFVTNVFNSSSIKYASPYK